MDPMAQNLEREQLEQLEQPQLNALGKLAAQVAQFGNNAVNNVQSSVNGMSTQGWIRLVIIVGAYMLLRPYVLKMITTGAVKKMEEDDAREKAQQAAISPNELRGRVEIPDPDEEELKADGTGTNWGSRARVRQRTFLKNMLEAEERLKEEQDDDKDIEDLLED